MTKRPSWSLGASPFAVVSGDVLPPHHHCSAAVSPSVPRLFHGHFVAVSRAPLPPVPKCVQFTPSQKRDLGKRTTNRPSCTHFGTRHRKTTPFLLKHAAFTGPYAKRVPSSRIQRETAGTGAMYSCIAGASACHCLTTCTTADTITASGTSPKSLTP